MFAGQANAVVAGGPGEGPRRVDVAFTDRHGGVCTGEYASLDLTRSRPGDDDALARNRRRLAAAFGVDELVTMRQVHGADVHVVRDRPDEPPTCDALVTDVPGIALCVRVGDCVPVVLADAAAGVVGVAHAGRPGVVAGVVPAVVRAMRDLGAGDIAGWLGPHVCGGCYEVPADLRAAVAEREPAAFACTTWGTPSLDLGAAVRAQLLRSGCGPVADCPDGAPLCTIESTDLFSYRRQGPASGRQAGLVVLRESADPGGLVGR